MLIRSKDECEDAYEEVFPNAEDVDVSEWNTSAYALGCFKHNYGPTGPTSLVYNLSGGPGTSGHCTGEPSYAACICRRVYGVGSPGPRGHMGAASTLSLAAEPLSTESNVNYAAISCAIGTAALAGYALYRSFKTKKVETVDVEF